MKNEIKFINPEKIFVAKNGSLLIWISKSMVSVVSILKLGITQWTLVKIASIKVSRIEIKKGQRTASFSNPDENGRVIEILKNGNDIEVDEKFYDDA